jgi:PAS domain S-box-containing protein
VATILAVDDDPFNRELLVTLLGYQKHRLLEASDGAEALALVRAHQPDLVITDILMPTMDGYEFVRQLRADPAIATTAVVFFTAHYHKNEAESLARSCGIAHILTKPCEPELILRIVEESLSTQPDLKRRPLPQDFGQQHLRVITDKLSQTADELQMSNHRLAALVDINLKLASERDHQQLLDVVCPAARNLLGAKYAALAARPSGIESEIYFVASGMDAATIASMGCPTLIDGVVGGAFVERKSRRLTNPQATGLPTHYPPTHSLLVAPIVSPAHVHGWICLTDKIGADEFSAEDERLLGILAAQVGRIYENARLYSDVQRYATRLEAEIEQRNRAQKALIESEGRFREMAENIRDVFFLVDAHSNRTLYISPAYAEIWGRSCESAYANPESWIEAIHPEDRATIHARYEAAMSGGQFDYEYRIVRPDRSMRWIEARIFPIFDNAGRIVRIAGVAADITERKHAANELREKERRFSDLLDNVELVSMMLDTNARITYCNDYLLQLTGWRRGDLLGQDWFKLFVPPEVCGVDTAFASLIAGLPEAMHHENEILTRSGERRLICWNNSLLRSGTGEVIGSASIGEDITEQKRYQESLRQNEERTRLILESVGEGIHGIDLSGKIIFENSAAVKLLGYSIEGLIGKPAHATMHHSRKDGIPYPVADCAIHTTMHDGHIRRVENEVFWRKDGSSFPVEYTTAPIRNDRKEITGAVVAFQDITHRMERRTGSDA